MRFVGMLRVKNEERWIQRAISSLLPLCDHVFVLDDHSSDGTAEIADSFDAVTVFDSPFGENDFSETRDKTWLLKQIVDSGIRPDYVICIDGDEELEPGGQHKIHSIFKRNKISAAYCRIAYLWNDPEHWRTDGIYATFSRPSIFRFDPNVTQYKSLYGACTTMHCSNVPYDYLPYAAETDIRLLHFGYMHPEDRIRKFHYYQNQDKDNPRSLELEDSYRHIVIGDLFPADSVFKHGGPLKLESLL